MVKRELDEETLEHVKRLNPSLNVERLIDQDDSEQEQNYTLKARTVAFAQEV